MRRPRKTMQLSQLDDAALTRELNRSAISPERRSSSTAIHRVPRSRYTEGAAAKFRPAMGRCRRSHDAAAAGGWSRPLRRWHGCCHPFSTKGERVCGVLPADLGEGVGPLGPPRVGGRPVAVVREGDEICYGDGLAFRHGEV